MDFVTSRLKKERLLALAGQRKATRPTIFVAFRMSHSSSISFRQDLEAGLRRRGNYHVLDGHVANAEPWADVIRKRISRAQLFVADVTGPSREVIFELGAGAGKQLHLVVDDSSDLDCLPDWLTSHQIDCYGDGNLESVVVQVVGKMTSPGYRRPRPQPTPGKVIWLTGDGSSWDNGIFNGFVHICREASLNVDRVTPAELTSYPDLQERLRGWLVVGCIDHGQQDYVAHYLAGDVAARPTCGQKGQKMNRKMILVGRDETNMDSAVADSVRRVSQAFIVRTTERRFLDEAAKSIGRYKRWLSQGHS